MPAIHPHPHSAGLDQAYSVLRHGGASCHRAGAELSVDLRQMRTLEELFRRRPPGHGSDAMRPRFARHQAHTAAVLALGGFPTLKR